MVSVCQVLVWILAGCWSGVGFDVSLVLVGPQWVGRENKSTTAENRLVQWPTDRLNDQLSDPPLNRQTDLGVPVHLIGK